MKTFLTALALAICLATPATTAEITRHPPSGVDIITISGPLELGDDQKFAAIAGAIKAAGWRHLFPVIAPGGGGAPFYIVGN